MKLGNGIETARGRIEIGTATTVARPVDEAAAATRIEMRSATASERGSASASAAIETGTAPEIGIKTEVQTEIAATVAMIASQHGAVETGTGIEIGIAGIAIATASEEGNENGVVTGGKGAAPDVEAEAGARSVDLGSDLGHDLDPITPAFRSVRYVNDIHESTQQDTIYLAWCWGQQVGCLDSWRMSMVCGMPTKGGKTYVMYCANMIIAGRDSHRRCWRMI